MKTPHLSIVTGASRGLGRAVCAQLLARGHTVVAIARRPADLPVPEGAALLSWSLDLAAPAAAARHLQDWLAACPGGGFSSATLINNAGVLTPPGPLSQIAADDLTTAMRVGLEAPLLLTAAFLRATTAWAVPRKVMLVSSGLGRRAMAGSAAYCAAKAGMDHLARAVALEEALRPDGARIVSLAPGVIDTDMQVQLRAADPADFPDHARFVGLKTGGLLDSPEQAATRLLAWLDRPDFGADPVADVRNP